MEECPAAGEVAAVRKAPELGAHSQAEVIRAATAAALAGEVRDSRGRREAVSASSVVVMSFRDTRSVDRSVT